MVPARFRGPRGQASTTSVLGPGDRLVHGWLQNRWEGPATFALGVPSFAGVVIHADQLARQSPERNSTTAWRDAEAKGAGLREAFSAEGSGGIQGRARSRRRVHASTSPAKADDQALPTSGRSACRVCPQTPACPTPEQWSVLLLTTSGHDGRGPKGRATVGKPHGNGQPPWRHVAAEPVWPRKKRTLGVDAPLPYDGVCARLLAMALVGGPCSSACPRLRRGRGLSGADRGRADHQPLSSSPTLYHDSDPPSSLLPPQTRRELRAQAGISAGRIDDRWPAERARGGPSGPRNIFRQSLWFHPRSTPSRSIRRPAGKKPGSAGRRPGLNQIIRVVKARTRLFRPDELSPLGTKRARSSRCSPVTRALRRLLAQGPRRMPKAAAAGPGTSRATPAYFLMPRGDPVS